MAITNPATPYVVAKNELAISDQHRLLASEQRRQVLDLLAEHSAPINLEYVASEVAVQTNDSVEELQIRLHHIHLPMMSEMNVLDYDPDTRIVRHFG